MTAPATETFVRAAEIWVPAADPARLRLHAATHGGPERFAAAGAPLECGRGEDLAGLVLASGRAEISEGFPESPWVPARETAAPGVAAGLGLPVFRKGELRAVAVLLCGRRDTIGGALEIWTRVVGRNELGLAASHHGGLDRWRRLSAALRLTPGNGLPGRTWQAGTPQIMEDLTNADSFLRAAAAESEGLTAGIGLPTFDRWAVNAVVLLLAVRSTPLARAIEVWTPTEGGEALRLADGTWADAAAFAATADGLRCASGAGAVGTAWATGLPLVVADPALLGRERAPAAAAAGISFGLALPLVREPRVRCVVLVLG